MAGSEMMFDDFPQRWILVAANFLGHIAARVEAASRGWIYGAWNLAGQYDSFSLVLWIRLRHGGKKRPCIRVAG